MCSTDLQFKDHVEHAIRAIGLQQLHDVGVFQHVADTGLSLQIWQVEIRREVWWDIVHIQQLVFHTSVIIDPLQAVREDVNSILSEF